MQGNDEEQLNFIQLLCLRSEVFPFLIKWFEKKTNKYVCQDIQNELLPLMSNTVVRKYHR